MTKCRKMVLKSKTYVYNCLKERTIYVANAQHGFKRGKRDELMVAIYIATIPKK